MVQAVRALVALLVLLMVGSLLPRDSMAATATPVVNRRFFFAGPQPQGSLTSSPPVGGLPSSWNLSKTPVYFLLPSILFSSVSLSGPPSFTIWLSGNTTSFVQTQGAFRWKSLNAPWSNFTTLPAPCLATPSPAPCTFSFNPNFGLSLTFGASVSVGINATVPVGKYVTLSWGASQLGSFVQLPLSGYSSVGVVSILDWTGNAAASFNLNATKGQNTVLIEAPVAAAFGKSDIGNVNLTIVDSGLRPVASARNITMSQIPSISTPQQTYPYVAEWTYPSNLTEGNYQVWIDIVDVQGSIAFSQRGPYGFGLFRPGIHATDLIPYGAGVTAAVGAGIFFYYRRRRTKEYLSPFDHFFTLTAGNIPQGTMVTVEGNTGSGKTLLAEQLMYDDLKSGKPCVFVSTADFPLKIRNGMRSLGLETEPFEGRDALKFVDCYSAEAGQPSPEKFYVSSPGDLTSLGVKISSALSDPVGGPSLFFDSLTPLVPRSKPESIVSFAQTIGAKVRGMGGKVFFTLGSSLDQSILRQLEEASDCIIQMEAFEEGGIRRRRMRISKFRNRRYHEGWVTFTIEDGKGIIFYSKTLRT